MALDFFAGCVGGVAGVIVGHPFDTVKVRLQTQDARNPKYKGTLHCLKTTIKQESVIGLYKGMSSPLVGVAFINAIIFGVYGQVQRCQSHPDTLMSITIAGATTGFVQSVVCSPMELVKLRVQLQDEASRHVQQKPVTTQQTSLAVAKEMTVKYKNPLDCLMQIQRTQGLRGVFRGYGITIVREIPGFGIYFATYETLVRLLHSSGETSRAVPVLIAGGFSGVASWLIAYPADVIKSRIQADEGVGASRTYQGIMDCAIKSYRSEGLATFFRGISSTVIRAFPTNAAVFVGVSWTFRLFGRREGDNVGTVAEQDSDKVFAS